MSRELHEGGKYFVPGHANYGYLGIDFAGNGAWDVHIKKLFNK